MPLGHVSLGGRSYLGHSGASTQECPSPHPQNTPYQPPLPMLCPLSSYAPPTKHPIAPYSTLVLHAP
eukprot:3778984-Rhodomonas_salina.1